MADPAPTSTTDVQPTTTSPSAPAPSEAPITATATTTGADATAASQEQATSAPAQPEPAHTATSSTEPPVAAAAAPTASATASDIGNPVWPELSASHPLKTLQSKLAKILKEAEYNEVYGVTLSAEEKEGQPIPFSTNLILQKFLRANANDVDKAASQLYGTLKWRKEFEPLKAKDEVFDADRFGGLGYITVLEGVPGAEGGHGKEIVTWNIYGAVKDHKATFGDLNGFLRWRVALMERSIAHLNLSSATTPIPDHGAGPDPYTIMQIHDYLSVKFLRMDPNIKAASKKTIEIFQAHYPETLSRKFFVNVPVVMGWVFGAVKLVLAKETVRKFTVLSYGEHLVNELGENVPTAYGGKGKELKELGETVNLESKPLEAEAESNTPSAGAEKAVPKPTGAGTDPSATAASEAAPGAPSVPAPTASS